MNKPNAEDILAKVEERRRRDREVMRRQEEAMDTLAVEAVQALTDGLRDVAGDATPRRPEPPVEMAAVVEEDARRAIEARGLQPARLAPAPQSGEPPLRAALRGVVADYAEPLMPSDRTVGDLESFSGIALDEADSYGLWADLQLKAAMAVRAEMADVIDIVTARAESVIVAELVAAGVRLASEYPDAPRPYAGEYAVDES
jgi:hypothetical protein